MVNMSVFYCTIAGGLVLVPTLNHIANANATMLDTSAILIGRVALLSASLIWLSVVLNRNFEWEQASPYLFNYTARKSSTTVV